MHFVEKPLGSVHKKTYLKALCLWLIVTSTVFLPSASGNKNSSHVSESYLKILICLHFARQIYIV